MIFDGGRGGGYQTVQMLGMINALKTGDPTTDTMIAMFLPVVLTKIGTEIARHGKELWMRRFKLMYKRCYKRTISHKTGGTNNNYNNGNSGGMSMEEDSYNCFLIKAIKLYMHKHCKFDPYEVDLELIDPNELEAVNGGGNPNMNRQQLRRVLGMANGSNNTTSTYGMLKGCSIIQRPLKQRWHDVGAFGGSPVKIMMMESKDNGGNGDRNNGNNYGGGNPDGGTPAQTFELRLESDGANSIDNFVSKAYNWYMEELKKNQSNDRFLYDLRGFDGRGPHKAPSYGRYTLGDEKTFESLFSKQCHNLLEVVDQFQSRTGKYAVSGYPYKLGLLLHGPPGSGKTSLIKALAHYCHRHIVNVPLARIQTNQDLMTLMFNHKFNVPGDPKPATLSFDQVIYVFEDIDAASDVVMRRDTRNKSKEEIGGVPPTDSAKQQMMAGGAVRGRMPRAAAAAGLRNPNGSGNDPRSLDSSMAAFGGFPPPNRAGQGCAFSDGDDLNLTGVLNALDGVVDTPGRIVIFTTNHPEMLDPALIRPGRIDKKLELSYMHQDDVVAMIEHYYQTDLSDPGRERVVQAVTGGEDGGEQSLKLVPAVVEQRSMEEGTVAKMIDWLETQRREQNFADGTSVTDTEDSSSTQEAGGSYST